MTKKLLIHNTDHDEIDAGISQDLGYIKKGSTISRIIGHTGGYQTRRGCVEALLMAANRRIIMTKHMSHDYIPGRYCMYEAEISARDYAMDTDLIGLCYNNRSSAVTIDYIDGLGAMVTQTITHSNDITTTCEYHFEVDVNSDHYDADAVREAANAIKAHDAYRYGEIHADLETYGITEHLDIAHTTTAKPHILVTNREQRADVAARTMTLMPTSDTEGVTGVIIQFDPHRQPEDLGYLPIAVCVRQADYITYSRRIETTYWSYRFDLVPNDDPTLTNPRDYADYVGARPY